MTNKYFKKELKKLSNIVSCLFVYILLTVVISGRCNSSDYYPSIKFLNNLNYDELTDETIYLVKKEINKHNLSKQFGIDKQKIIEIVAKRMVNERKFIAKLEKYDELIDKRVSPPLNIFPERYLSSERLLNEGRKYADERLAEIIEDYWMDSCRISLLELKLITKHIKENKDYFSKDKRLKTSAGYDAKQMIQDLRREPYRLIDQLVLKQKTQVKDDEQIERMLKTTSISLIKEAGLNLTAEYLLYTRIKLRPIFYKSSRPDQLGSLMKEISGRTKTRWQYPCDWSSTDRDQLLLASNLLLSSGIALEDINEFNIGYYLIYVSGLSPSQISKLEDHFKKDVLWINVKRKVAKLIKENKEVSRELETLRGALEKPGNFDGNIEQDEAKKWVTVLSKCINKDLNQMVKDSKNVSSRQAELMMEEAKAVLPRILEPMWIKIIEEQIKLRQTRIVKLNAADLGDLREFKAFSGWPLREKVRLVLEKALKREGWKSSCIDNYFISRSLDDRSEQLTHVIKRVIGN